MAGEATTFGRLRADAPNVSLGRRRKKKKMAEHKSSHKDDQTALEASFSEIKRDEPAIVAKTRRKKGAAAARRQKIAIAFSKAGLSKPKSQRNRNFPTPKPRTNGKMKKARKVKSLFDSPFKSGRTLF